MNFEIEDSRACILEYLSDHDTEYNFIERADPLVIERIFAVVGELSPDDAVNEVFRICASFAKESVASFPEINFQDGSELPLREVPILIRFRTLGLLPSVNAPTVQDILRYSQLVEAEVLDPTQRESRFDVSDYWRVPLLVGYTDLSIRESFLPRRVDSQLEVAGNVVWRAVLECPNTEIVYGHSAGDCYLVAGGHHFEMELCPVTGAPYAVKDCVALGVYLTETTHRPVNVKYVGLHLHLLAGYVMMHHLIDSDHNSGVHDYSDPHARYRGPFSHFKYAKLRAEIAVGIHSWAKRYALGRGYKTTPPDVLEHTTLVLLEAVMSGRLKIPDDDIAELLHQDWMATFSHYDQSYANMYTLREWDMRLVGRCAVHVPTVVSMDAPFFVDISGDTVQGNKLAREAFVGSMCCTATVTSSDDVFISDVGLAYDQLLARVGPLSLRDGIDYAGAKADQFIDHMHSIDPIQKVVDVTNNHLRALRDVAPRSHYYIDETQAQSYDAVSALKYKLGKVANYNYEAGIIRLHLYCGDGRPRDDYAMVLNRFISTYQEYALIATSDSLSTDYYLFYAGRCKRSGNVCTTQQLAEFFLAKVIVLNYAREFRNFASRNAYSLPPRLENKSRQLYSLAVDRLSLFQNQSIVKRKDIEYAVHQTYAEDDEETPVPLPAFDYGEYWRKFDNIRSINRIGKLSLDDQPVLVSSLMDLSSEQIKGESDDEEDEADNAFNRR